MKTTVYKGIRNEPGNILLLILTAAILFFYTGSSAQENYTIKENTEDYLKNSWILVKTTINDTVASSSDCTIFFHHDGKYGRYCSMEVQLNVLSKWSIKKKKFIIENGKEGYEYDILEKTAGNMTLERMEMGRRVKLYCVWK